MYSMGLETRASLMFSISHIDSSSRCLVFSKKRWRQSMDMDGTVRCHKSHSARSTGLVGSGGGDMSSGMKSGSRSR